MCTVYVYDDDKAEQTLDLVCFLILKSWYFQYKRKNSVWSVKDPLERCFEYALKAETLSVFKLIHESIFLRNKISKTATCQKMSIIFIS